MLQYTFLNHPILNIMENLSIDYSGIKNAYGLFCNIDKRLKIAQYQENNVSFIKTGKGENGRAQSGKGENRRIQNR